MTLPGEQRKQIEKEAEKLYPIDDPRKNMLHDNLGQYSRRDAYIIGAKKYASLCHQKAEEIARLRSVLEWYADPGNYLDENSDLATAWKMDENIANKAKEAIKKQAHE